MKLTAGGGRPQLIAGVRRSRTELQAPLETKCQELIVREFKSSVEELYDAFKAYPLRPKIEGCPHCDLGAAEDSLHGRELRELTWDDLGVFPFKAMTTFGDDIDYRHFLPRILELHAQDPAGALYDLEITLGKLDYASWYEWPTRERRAIETFVNCWLRLLEATVAQSDERWILGELRAAMIASKIGRNDA